MSSNETSGTENKAIREAFAAQNPGQEFIQPEQPQVKVTGTAEELVRSLNPTNQKDA